MASACPAIPLCSAIQPAYRPITSTTRMRLCACAVVCSRSMHSVANETAEENPKVETVERRSLSIVLGTPTTRKPFLWSCRAMVRLPSPPTATCASILCLWNASITRSD